MLSLTNKALLLGSALILLAANTGNAIHLLPQKSPQKMPSNPSKLTKEEAKVSRFWNRMANTYSKSPIKDQESYEKKLEITRSYFKPTSRVLEFGCGTGGTALLHAAHVKSIDAIDVSSKMIEIAQEKQKSSATNTENVKFSCRGLDSLVGDDTSAPAPYDVVMGMSILHLMPEPDKALSQVHRLLAPGGIFVSSTVCMGDFAGFFSYIGPPLSFMGILPKLHVFTKDELKDCIEKAGFSIEEEFHPGNDKAVFFVARKLG